MLTNNKEKTREKKKITKPPMKYLANWSIDT